jgi:hypothetical protein
VRSGGNRGFVYGLVENGVYSPFMTQYMFSPRGPSV